MTTSSQPKNLSIDSSSQIDIDDILKSSMVGTSSTSENTITISSGTGLSSYTYDFGNLTSIPGQPGTYAISTDTITLNTISASQFSFNFPKEWHDTFPEWHRVQSMCDKYPGLKIAFDNFKVFYEMVKDDYDNPTPKK
jgi:hypothetical protein